MKIATALSLSALLAMFSVVACSSPTTPANGGKAGSAATSGDDDDDSTAKKTTKTSSSSSSSSSSGSTAKPPATGDDDDDAIAACDTCMASKDPKVKAAIDCADKCTDGACSDKCFSDAGCTLGSTTDICGKAHAACQTECKASDTADATAEKAFDDCIAKNAQAKAINDCEIAAKSDADQNKCDAMACDKTCDDLFTTCSK